MSDDEAWSTTDEESSTSDGSQELSNCSADNSSTHSYVQRGQGDPKMFRHVGCQDPDHVRALDREIREHTQLLSMILGTLGGFYRDRYLHPKEAEDLNQCIKYISHALLLSPDTTAGQSDLEEYLELLSASHHDRFHLSGSSEDLDEDIGYRTRAFALSPTDLDWASTLSHAYSLRYRRLENLGDLEQAIHYGTLAISRISHNEPGTLARLDALIDAYALRSKSLCTINEIEKGIEYGTLAVTLAVTLTPEGDPKLPWRRMVLSMLYLKAFYHRGHPTDLDNCIDWGDRSLSIMSESHPDLSSQINNLAISYSLRFERLKEPNDLQRAIECGARALVVSPSNYLSHFKTLANLSCLCLKRFNLYDEVSDLERGIDYSARAYSLVTHELFITKGWEWEANRLNTLGGLYFARSEHLEDPEDLENAIECCKLAISLAPDENHHAIALSLYSLGQYIHTRWHLLGDNSDLNDDIDNTTHAVSLVAFERNPYLSIQLQSLGMSHIAAFRLGKCGKTCPMLRHALDYFQQACHAVGPPSEKLRSARRWAHYARGNDMLETLDAYQVAMDLIPQVIWLGTSISRGYSEVEDLSTLAVEAASAAITVHDYKRALEWLEQGRSIVIKQVSMLQSPLDRLYLIDPSLAQRIHNVAQELRQTTSRMEDSLSLIHLDPTINLMAEQVSQRSRQLAMEYDDLVSQVRQRPGFESFLKPKKAAELVAAADTGPVVIISSYDCHRCDALIVQPGISTITHLELPSFTCDKASELQVLLNLSLTQVNSTERGTQRRPISSNEASDLEHVLSILWEDIAKPVLDALGYKVLN